MGKLKEPKAPINLKPEFVLPKGQAQKQRKKSKNAPDRPQPEWMFPPDEQNPVLNPKTKSDEQKRREKEEHDASIDYLRHRSVTAPMKAPPPALLLTLVGGFLTSYGFDGASRLYTTQLDSRKKLDDWKIELGARLPKGFPGLVKIFKEWHKEYERTQQGDDDTSESDTDGSALKKVKKTSRGHAEAGKEAAPAAIKKEDETSSSESEGSDVEMKDAQPMAASARKSSKSKAIASAPSSTSTSSSSSDSDADDEEDAHSATGDQQQAGIKDGKKKAKKARSPSGSSSLDAGSDPAGPSAAGGKAAAKKAAAKTSTPKAEGRISAGTRSSNSDSFSDSESDSAAPATTAAVLPPTTNSDSSETLQATSGQRTSTANTSLSSTSTSSSDTDSPTKPTIAAAPAVDPAPSKRKRSASPVSAPGGNASKKTPKKSNTPFQRVPADTPIDPKLASNAYRPYDYAQKAHQDLSVTRGRGFTKEKNKKKRGSYRGGVIDIEGGKGIKFED